jgi:hypothetical protein
LQFCLFAVLLFSMELLLAVVVSCLAVGCVVHSCRTGSCLLCTICTVCTCPVCSLRGLFSCFCTHPISIDDLLSSRYIKTKRSLYFYNKLMRSLIIFIDRSSTFNVHNHCQYVMSSTLLLRAGLHK